MFYLHLSTLGWNIACRKCAKELICSQCGQLQLTYRTEEGPSEESKISSDEAEAPASDNADVANVEITPPPTPPPPQNNLETGDLLVNMFQVSLTQLCFCRVYSISCLLPSPPPLPFSLYFLFFFFLLTSGIGL